MKLSEYLKNISEAPFDVAMPTPNMIALFKGSKDGGKQIASIKAEGATTGKTKQVKVGDKTVTVNFLNDASAQSLFDQLLKSSENQAWKITPEAVSSFLTRYRGVGIPFTNNVIELDIQSGQITLSGNITQYLK